MNGAAAEPVADLDFRCRLRSGFRGRSCPEGRPLRHSRGFTLIELIITVAVIGILAAIALPAYQGYVNRAKMSEGIVQLGALRSAIVEEFSTRGFPDQARLDALLPNGSPTSLVAEVFGEIDAYSVSGGECSLPAQASPQARASVCGNAGTSGGVVRLVARMNASQFSGMTANVNDQLALEGYVTGGQILWFCRPDGTRGVKTDWVPATCRS